MGQLTTVLPPPQAPRLSAPAPTTRSTRPDAARSTLPAPVTAGPGGSYVAPPAATHGTTAAGRSAPHSSAAASAATDPDEQAIRTAYDQYLYVYSGLMAYLNRTWIEPLADVATTDLATATVRAAGAIKNAHEHAVGQLRHSRVEVVRHGADRASIADCQDQLHFYLISDKTGKPDPAIGRGYFVGAAELVRIDGRWLVSVYTTTHQECDS